MKKVLLMVTLCVSTITHAQTSMEWCLMAHGSDGNIQTIAMNTVGSLVATDNEDTFSVLDKYGAIIADYVLEVTFEEKDLSTINGVMAKNNKLSYTVDNNIVIMGTLANSATIYNAGGQAIAYGKSDAGMIAINVSILPTGTYDVKCGSQTFKFNKK